MEPWIAQLERDVARLRGDFTESKFDSRANVDRLDARIARLEAKLDRLSDSAVNQSGRRRDLTINALSLVLYVLITATLWGTLARGFGWI